MLTSLQFANAMACACMRGPGRREGAAAGSRLAGARAREHSSVPLRRTGVGLPAAVCQGSLDWEGAVGLHKALVDRLAQAVVRSGG
eukprot:COSAG02_NODE_2682_length_8253_cov_3.591857_1_plen_86_part_00